MHKAHCSFITDSRLAPTGAGGVGGGVMDVAALDTGTTEGGGAGMQGGDRGCTITWLTCLSLSIH